MANPLLKTVPQGAKEWKALLGYFEKNQEVFSHNNDGLNEWKSIEDLREYAQREYFDNAKIKSLLQANLSKPFLKFHKDGTDERENLSVFIRLCKDYLFTDREVFEAFQKEIGGKQDNGEREQEKQQGTEREEEEQKGTERQEEQKQEHQEQEKKEEPQYERQQKWYQKWQYLLLAAIAALCLIIGAFFAIKSDVSEKEIETENFISSFDPQMLIGDYTAKHKIDGQLAGDIMNGYIEALSQDEYQITIYSDYDPVSFSFTYDGKTILSPDIPKIEFIHDGNYRQIKIIFKKDNQLWEFTKELAR